MANFEELGVPQVIRDALAQMHYEHPTPVQAAGLPPILEGGDVLLEAETGSGKTAAFGIPAVVTGSKQRGLRVLVLVPTRELARQVSEEIREIGTGSPFRAVAVTGGVLGEQEERAIAGDVRCIVATPGRLIALQEEGKLKLSSVRLVIVDEADRMLDMGFKPDVERILEMTQNRKQTVMVSATLSSAVVELGRAHMRDIQEVRVGHAGSPESLEHWRVNIFKGQKEPALIALLRAEEPERAIVFVETRRRAIEFTKLLKAAGFPADQLQGEMSHDQRRHVFDMFQRGVSRILVATDIASRGLDVPEMELVINADLPGEADAYSHRAGRAGRLGRGGKVVSFVRPEEKAERQSLEAAVGIEWKPYRLAFDDSLLPPAWRAAKAPPPVQGRRGAPMPPPKKRGPERVPKPSGPRRGPTEDLPPSRRERRQRGDE